MFSCGHDGGNCGSLAEMWEPMLLLSLFPLGFGSQPVKWGHCFDPDECCGGKCIQDWEIHPSCSNEEPPNPVRVAWPVKASLPLSK